MARLASATLPPHPAASRRVTRRFAGPPPLALRLAAVLVVPIMLYALYATGLKAVDNYRAQQEVQALQDQVRALRDENIRLLGVLERARTDAAIETIAREQLGLVKPGDHALILLPAVGQVEPAPAAPTSAPTPTQSPIEQWRDYFIGPGQ